MESAGDKNAKWQPHSSAALSLGGGAAMELLSPAGDVAAAKGAYAAGADAVYIGAKSFSARAFAQNAQVEELCDLLDYARLLDKKLYLACNILIKDSEFDELFRLMDPLYEHGLHAVIVQDIGLLSVFQKRYPQLHLHASTQMSVMSTKGIEWLARCGVRRVVPARELSIEELRELSACGMELECFVHGAMCYSYSGRCLLSSMAGGRSGNRGRCAGPCRKAYQLHGEEPRYYLSMKDMCAVHALRELAEAGVRSLKIEGRMKAPEYAALVTAIYRKYLDRCAAGEAGDIEPDDLRALERMYLRSERQEGYLHKANGKSMISLSSPAYAKVSEEEKEKIRARYLEQTPALFVDMELYAHQGEALRLRVFAKGSSVCVHGGMADPAKNRPLTAEDIKKQLAKTKNTAFVLRSCEVDTDGESFASVGALNALRREALERLLCELAPARQDKAERFSQEYTLTRAARCRLIAGVGDEAQFETVLRCAEIEGVILTLDMFVKKPEEYITGMKAVKKSCYLRLPGIVRQKWLGDLSRRLLHAFHYAIDGIYCGCIDALALAEEFVPAARIHADQGLYVFNRHTEFALRGLAGYTVCAELSGREAGGLARRDRAEWIVYGRTPLMYSANCVYKTDRGCKPEAGFCTLTDELGHGFVVRPVHTYCYNVLYNCVPLMLYEEAAKLRESGYGTLRLEFTDESAEKTDRIAKAYAQLLSPDGIYATPDVAYTRGHYKKGVE